MCSIIYGRMEAAGQREVFAGREQMSAMVRDGHEINLHLDPQWLSPELDAGGHWHLRDRDWRLGDLDAATVHESFQRAVDWITATLADVAPEYRWLAFRAGGWAIQPSPRAINVLLQHRFAIESSVAPETCSTHQRAWFDFRRAPALPHWTVDEDVMRVGDGQIVEVPIAVGQVSALRHLRALKARRRTGEFAPGCQGTYQGRAPSASRLLSMLDRLRGSGRAMLDTCALPASLMIEIVEGWVGRHSEHVGPLPIVAIGHTKNFSKSAEQELDQFLAWASGKKRFRISTYADWLSNTNGRCLRETSRMPRSTSPGAQQMQRADSRE